jgi:predicted DNA-binding transcriptional regulator AlpA
MDTTAKSKPASAPIANDGPALLSAKQAADLLGVSRTAFWCLRQTGKIPSPVALLTGHPRWRRSDLLRFVERLRPFTGGRRSRPRADEEQPEPATAAV